MSGQRSMGLALAAGAGLLVVAAAVFMRSGKGKGDEPKSSAKEDNETASVTRSLNFTDTMQTTGKTAKEQPKSVEENASVSNNTKKMTAESIMEAEKSPRVSELKQKFENKIEKKAIEKSVPVPPVTATKVKAPAVESPAPVEPKGKTAEVPPPSESKEAVESPAVQPEKESKPATPTPAVPETKTTPVKEPVVDVQKKENGGNAASKEPENKPKVAGVENPVEKREAETIPVPVEGKERKAEESIPAQDEKAAPTSPSSSQSTPVVVETTTESEQPTDKEQLDDGNWVTVDATKTGEDEENQAAANQETDGTTAANEASSAAAPAKPAAPKGPGAAKKGGKRSNKKKNKGKKKK
mmetsp:Transcript_4589/g.9258  ORF Transcript_4589/g.9258 Transcript_4589/m.9258 type:complete len:355 (+) Transcript_4589:104-1168(+)